MVLFHADPASEGWRSYLEYMDELLVEGLFSYINHSLQFFVDNMEIWPSQPPLFEAQLLLNGSVLGFNPSVDRDAGDGLYELVEGLIGDIFKSSMYIQRVAGHLSMETYQVLCSRFKYLHVAHCILTERILGGSKVTQTLHQLIFMVMLASCWGCVSLPAVQVQWKTGCCIVNGVFFKVISLQINNKMVEKLTQFSVP